MNLPLRADVYCSDVFGGTTSHIILKPNTDEVTHLVVRLSMREASQRIVPITYLVSTTAQAIVLSCDFTTLEMMPHFSLTTHTKGTVPVIWTTGVYENTPVIPLNATIRRAMTTEQIPEGEVVIGDHARGNTVDGHIGRVAALDIDPTTHRISKLILHEGVLWGRKMVSIPVEAVDFFDEEAVYLKWDKERLAELPPMAQREHA